MLWIFYSVKDYFRRRQYCIDNLVFKLHYQHTAAFLIVACILVCQRQYIGEHISCISDMRDGGFQRALESFCFFTSTFTIIKDHDYTRYRAGYAAHPGVGAYGIGSKEPIRRHYYYQWVPFVLFGQALMFCLTHMLWKKCEGGRIGKLTDGLDHASFSTLEKDDSNENRQILMHKFRRAFTERIKLYKSWAVWLTVFEILNFVHIILQFYITDAFLGHQFLNYGPKVLAHGQETMDEVFPKQTKCTFYKYGASGSIQVHDSLCIMALNIVNEKIYVGLWFWFLVLAILSGLAVLWRFLTVLLRSRSVNFNRIIFGQFCPKNAEAWKIIMKHCSFGDWLFLKYLSKNMNGLIFRELFLGMIEDLQERRKTLLSENSNELGWKFRESKEE